MDKKASVSSDLLVGHVTSLQNESGLSKYLSKCIIRYFGRPCDESAERVWPIKISDGAQVTLFNKGLVSCDINQSFLILLFEWEYVSFMMISCIFCYRRYCMMWRHLAPPPLWVSWYIIRLLTIEKTRKHDTIQKWNCKCWTYFFAISYGCLRKIWRQQRDNQKT